VTVPKVTQRHTVAPAAPYRHVDARATRLSRIDTSSRYNVQGPVCAVGCGSTANAKRGCVPEFPAVSNMSTVPAGFHPGRPSDIRNAPSSVLRERRPRAAAPRCGLNRPGQRLLTSPLHRPRRACDGEPRHRLHSVDCPRRSQQTPQDAASGRPSNRASRARSKRGSQAWLASLCGRTHRKGAICKGNSLTRSLRSIHHRQRPLRFSERPPKSLP